MRSLCTLALLLCADCAGPGPYVWVTQLPFDHASDEYVISVGDMVSVRVLGHEDMLTRVRVRSDGRIAMPILGDVDVRGKRPSAVRTELEARFKDYIVSPSVTVNVEESRPATVVVLGEVMHPGTFPIETGGGVAQALSAAGGLTDFAARSRIFVVRRGQQIERIRFAYEDVTRGERASSQFLLQNGDMVVVE